MQPPRYVAAAVMILALSLSVPRAEAGPAAIGNCGKVVAKSGSYVLASNLSVRKQGQDCITVTTSFVTIDLQGFAIDCANVGNDGINVTGRGLKGITVRNGTIINCLNGVDASGVTGALVEGIVAIDNTDDGIEVGAGSTVRDNVANGNGVNGISATCPSNVIDNTAINNTSGGLKLGSTCNAANNASDS